MHTTPATTQNTTTETPMKIRIFHKAVHESIDSTVVPRVGEQVWLRDKKNELLVFTVLGVIHEFHQNLIYLRVRKIRTRR